LTARTALAQNIVAMQTTSPIGMFTIDYTPLRRRRRVLGLTLRRMQAITGIPFQTTNRIEWNQQDPKVRQLIAISRALGVPMHDLYTIREQRERST
jgi:DNA-binding XRE family transcriptional regulator